MSRRRIVFAAVFALGAVSSALAACDAVLGLDSLKDLPGAGGDEASVGNDGGPGSDATPDVEITEGSSDDNATAAGNDAANDGSGGDAASEAGDGGGCVSACTPGSAASCVSGALQACVVTDAGCAAEQTAPCGAGLVCERYDAAACVDPTWAEWPIPNSPSDSPPAPNLQSFTANNDGTVTDNVTGLMWQQSGSTATYIWGTISTGGSAQNYCSTATTGGYKDWRLPSQIELLSIVDWSVSSPAINTTYFLTPSAAFWSTTGTSADPWWVDFTSGFSCDNNDTDTPLTVAYARCVR